MAQLLGRAFIRANGNLLRSETGARIDLGGTVRSAVVGDVAVHGYAEQLKPAQVQCELALARGDELAGIRDLVDATVTFEADTGQVYIVREAFVTETLTITAGAGGKIAVTFEGQPAEEMAA